MSSHSPESTKVHTLHLMSKPTISSCDDDNEPHNQALCVCVCVCSHMDYFNNEENCLWKNDDCQANSGASFFFCGQIGEHQRPLCLCVQI